MALDAFLFFKDKGAAGDDIQGETQDKFMRTNFGGNIPFDLQAWSFGLSQDVKIGSASGGVGAGKVTFEQFKVTKAIDKSSPSFFLTCCNGGHFGTVSLMIRKSGTDPKQSGGIYLQFDFKLVFVSNIAWSHADPAPTEEITFDYGALKITYKKQDPKGILVAPPDGGQAMWSRILNNTDFDGTPT